MTETFILTHTHLISLQAADCRSEDVGRFCWDPATPWGHGHVESVESVESIGTYRSWKALSKRSGGLLVIQGEGFNQWAF